VGLGGVRINGTNSKTPPSRGEFDLGKFFSGNHLKEKGIFSQEQERQKK